jgi:NADH-quinone oxidoreductase subunit N
MTIGNLLTFSPEGWLLLGSLAVLAWSRVRRERGNYEAGWIALAAVVLALAALATQLGSTLTILDGAFLLDRFAGFSGMIVLASAVVVLLLALSDPDWSGRHGAAYAGFTLLALTGGLLMVSAADLITVFIASQLFSLALVTMTALPRREPGWARSGLIALTASMVGAALLGYGLALIYGLTGETRLTAAGAALASAHSSSSGLVLALALVIAGLGAQLGIVPLQGWRVRLARRAVMPVLAFVASAGMVATFALFARLISTVFAHAPVATALTLAVLALITMTTAGLAALSQTTVRGLLAWALVGQAGYGLIGVAALSVAGLSALLIFLLSAAIASLTAFGWLMVWPSLRDRLPDLHGIGDSAPLFALGLSLGFASLIGIPPLIGFFGRVFLLEAAVQSRMAWLALFGVLNTLLGAAAGLRLLAAVYLEPTRTAVEAPALTRPARVALAATTFGVVTLGAFLTFLYPAAQHAAQAILP